MAQELGTKLDDTENMVTHFKNPLNQHNVYIMFDACHMLKVIRNNWATLNIIVDRDGGIIDFNLINLLCKIQQEEDFQLGTKTRKLI